MRMLSDWRTVVLRLGVVICVAVTALTAAGRLDDTIAVFDFVADANAQRSYTERTYPELSWVAGSSTVLEEARLRMPKDATYRVVEGPRVDNATVLGIRPLLPARAAPAETSRWTTSPPSGCSATDATQSTLGDRFDVLSDSGDGFLFGRMTS